MTPERNRLKRRAAFFKGATRGAAAVEFALIAVPVLFLILVTFQLILVTTARIALDTAAYQLASDAANADPVELATVLNRDTLCANTAFVLVNCVTDKSLCFSVRTIDPAVSAPPPVEFCTDQEAEITPTACCYEIRIEYPVPLALDFIRVFLASLSSTTAVSMIRTVALVYRA